MSFVSYGARNVDAGEWPLDNSTELQVSRDPSRKVLTIINLGPSDVKITIWDEDDMDSTSFYLGAAYMYEPLAMIQNRVTILTAGEATLSIWEE